MISAADRIVLDGQRESVAHELDVAEHGLAADFEILGEAVGIEVPTGGHERVDAHHALEGRTGLRQTGEFALLPG
jgi:hypothetical protein